MARRRHQDVLAQFPDLAGQTVVDVGCGDGDLVRELAERGAIVFGVELRLDRLRRARAMAPVANEAYVAADGVSLPLADGFADLVIFFNSLHHVAVDLQTAALADAARVLKPGGLVYLSEPVAEGANFELGRLIDDETEIRARAHQAIREAAAVGLSLVEERIHVSHLIRRDFETYRARMTATSPKRAAAFTEFDEEIRARFERLGQPADKGWSFEQPMRINLLRKNPA